MLWPTGTVLSAGAACHVPVLGRWLCAAGDLSEPRAMWTPGSGPARFPQSRRPRFAPLLPPLWLLLLVAVGPARGWESGDLELFDLVEEVQLNFYQFLGVQQDASSADIRKAYRKLSLTLHPDKNKDENAETQFRQLVAIYEVLKDDERRQRYDDILINGLPDWRQPVFYYRRVRKMSNAELALLLFIILTVGHYAVVWSIYLEKQLDELLSRKKREKKKGQEARVWIYQNLAPQKKMKDC